MGVRIALMLAAAGLSGPAFAQDKDSSMDIIRGAQAPSSEGSADYFTGKVRIASQFQREAPSRLAGAIVSFEPGARTHWHTHPLGQTLIVTEGTGWTQCEGGPIVEIRKGDVLFCPPGHKHWHGATPGNAMTHIALQEALDGKVVEWMEPVTDGQYLAGRNVPVESNR